MNTNSIKLTKNEKKDIEKIIRLSLNNPPTLENMWYLMDKIWDDLKCNNKKLDWKKISQFYNHPIWILNGIFIEQHKLSMQHRNAISDWIIKNNKKLKLNEIIDFGGGFGTLSELIAKKQKNIKINFFDPFPHNAVVQKLKKYKNIKLINSLNVRNCDCLISIDVLEHVKDPLKNLFQMVKITRVNGFLIIANCFYPVIKCHLPKTFHLRYSFNLFTKLMGLKKIGICEGSHATIYQKIKNKKINWLKIKILEKISILFFLFRKPFFICLKIFKQILKKLKLFNIIKKVYLKIK